MDREQVRIIGLFCKRALLLQGSFAKETYNLKEPMRPTERDRHRARLRESEREEKRERGSE